MPPRIIFPSIQVALKASPFFIDEDEVGPWLSSSNEGLFALGTVITFTRNAIHIPSLERTGEVIEESVIADFCQQAAALGLAHTRDATGYWTLASAGEVQKEKVKIVFTEDYVDPEVLRGLAKEIALATNQEAVAIEVAGMVEQHFG